MMTNGKNNDHFDCQFPIRFNPVMDDLWERMPDIQHTSLYENAFENNEGKEEIAANQHFLLFPQCFLPLQSQKQNSI